jgi:hypothetical protein
MGLEAKGCVFAEIKATASFTTTSNGGDEARSTASFNTGLRLPNTPFPEAPVGSLLVVLADPVSGAVRDVRVVHGGGTSVVVEQASNAYLVVNDKQCTTAGIANALSVSVRAAKSQAPVAEQALVSMAEVLGDMRQQRVALVKQGTLLPSQATLLRQQATQKLQTHLREIDVDALPGPLAALFEAFVSHQVVATERQIAIRAIERSLDLDVLEIRMVDDEIRAGAAQARLQRLVPQWILRDLDHDTLRQSMVDVLGLARDHMKPALELWYPTAREAVSNRPEITAMLNADIDSSLVTLAGNAAGFGRALVSAYENGIFGSKPQGQQLPIVVLNFPRPGFVYPASFWRQADATRSRRVWDAIDRRTVAHLEITPEDFYSKNGGDAVLSCSEVVPLIKTMEVYLVRPGGDLSNQILNGAQRTFVSLAAAGQSFVTPEGPRIYELANSAWQRVVLPVRYGEDEAAATTFQLTPRQQRPVGLSASGAFDVDFSVLNTLPQHGEFDIQDNRFPIIGIQLVMELDSRAVGANDVPTWVNRCK